MTGGLLLDTCAIIWLSQDRSISGEASQAINHLKKSESKLFASPISAWEIGLLTARSRLVLPMDTKIWFEWYLRDGMVTLAGLSPEVLIDSSHLPGNPPNDPADRIIIATARAMNIPIITRDKKILNYTDCGHAKSIEC